MYIFLQNKKNIFAIAKCLNFNAVERQTEWGQKQGGRIGRMFAHWAIVFFGQFSKKYRNIHIVQCSGYYFQR
jgi:hypothetical protein